ncbi:MAG TPA: hypothetical protein VLJ39_16175 [Tepidisphaeraceae bacterium]|nr:hypothetical protein [Tepidisphaeraceae bacterium]
MCATALPGTFCAILLFVVTAASADVTIDRKPPVVEHRTFDPAHPPADMPPLNANEAAITQTDFECGAAVAYQVMDRKPGAHDCETTIQVRSVTVTLQLRIVIWLPRQATPKLGAHEEGHRRIAERVYEGAEPIARKAAAKLDGATLRGQATDCQAAEKQSVNRAADQINQSYLDQTAKPASRINDIYDDLTGHGTKAEPAEDEAIRQAFERATRDR